MGSSARSEGGTSPLRLALGLARFSVALTGVLLRLVVTSGREPDPIHLQPRVLLRTGGEADQHD